MSNFVPESDDLRKALIFCFHLKKSAAESHRMLVEAYGDHALSEATCKRWFQRFRDNDFDVRNKERSTSQRPRQTKYKQYWVKC